MSYEAKRRDQQRRRDKANECGNCTKCYRAPKLPGYQLCGSCRERVTARNRNAHARTEAGAIEQKGVDQKVHKQVRQLCYSLTADGHFDDGLPEYGEYVEPPIDWYHEREDAEDAISPF